MATECTNMELLNGQENFTLNGKETEIKTVDFWSYAFSNLMDKEDEIAEFLVATALGVKDPTNKLYWTLYDVLYRETRIEVKQTSYYHPWTHERSKTLRFDIAPRDGSNREEPYCEPGLHRQNDIYVFCIVDGGSFEESYPLNLDAWTFYVVPTTVINRDFPETQKAVLATSVKKNYADYACKFDKLAERVNAIIDSTQK